MIGKTLSPGENIAIKVPQFKFEETVLFYEQTIGLKRKETIEWYVAFEFGSITLWIDRMETYAQSDVWLELYTQDLDTASAYLKEKQVPRRDEVEKQENGFWVSDPAGTILRVGKSSNKKG